MADYVEDSDLEAGDSLTASNLAKITGNRRGHVLPIDTTTSNYSNSTHDIGATSNKWKDLHCSGTLYGSGIDIMAGNTLKMKKVQLGSWIFTTASAQYSNSDIEVPYKKITDIKVFIYDDSGDRQAWSPPLGIGVNQWYNEAGTSNYTFHHMFPIATVFVFQGGGGSPTDDKTYINIEIDGLNTSGPDDHKKALAYYFPTLSWDISTGFDVTAFNDSGVDRGYILITYID